MKRYPAYKDSGFEWIGELPHHWDKSKIKYNTYVKGRIGWQGLTTNEYINEGPFLITGTDFRNGIIDWGSCYHVSYDRHDQDPFIQVQENDLLITKDGTIGKIALVKNLPTKATLNSGVFVTRPLNGTYTNSFMFWVLNSKVFYEYIEYIKTGTTISHLYQNTFVEFAYPVPSTDEQLRISEYLDYKTHLLDTLIEKKKKQIELLQEQRTAIINQAVTKGLNPNVKMKDSGIEWLGEVPEHWQPKKVGYVAKIFRGSGYQNIEKSGPEENENVIKMVRINDFHKFSPIHIKHTDIIDNYLISKNDILFAGTGATAGITMCVDESMEGFAHSYNILKLRPHAIFPKFLYYSLNSNLVKDQENILFSGSAQHFLDMESIANLRILYPPKEEQALLSKELDAQINKIDRMIQKLQKIIEHVTEYRTALISEVVTGKIDVRDEAIP